jgi:hypothetical protein
LFLNASLFHWKGLLQNSNSFLVGYVTVEKMGARKPENLDWRLVADERAVT